MEHSSLVEYFRLFQQHGHEYAYVNRRPYRSIRWTYLQIFETACQLARELEQRGISKSDRVLLCGANSAEWVIAFFGCMLRGIVVVPIDDVATVDFANRVYQQVDARLLIGSRAHTSESRSAVAMVLEEIPDLVRQHPKTAYPAAELRPEDVLELVFTSGTTAEPKGVVITHSNVLANLEPLEKEMTPYLKYERLVHPVRFLNLLPLSHVFGQFLGMFLPPLMGGTVVFQETLSPAEIIATIRKERISVLVAVPRILQSLKEKLERELQETGQLESFRAEFRQAEGKHFLCRWWIFRRVHRKLGWKFWAFVCGGATLDRVTEEFWGRLGYAVIQGYGLTETTSLISVNHPFKLGKGSVGKVLAGREIKLDASGEILVRGSGVASAYWSNRELKPVAAEEGWYHTGDVGEFDESGNLYFKGRQKNVIVTSAGMNVYPEDLEAALRRQPELKDCVVIGLERDGNAEACAVLIFSNPATDVEGVIRRANENLAEYQQMREWFVWPDHDFPRTSTQKPKTNDIQEFVQQHLGQRTSLTSDRPLSQIMSRITGKTLTNLQQDANLEADLNLSSLDRVELMSALEDRYQLDLGETNFAAARTVGDLEKLIRGQAAPRVEYHYPRWTLRWPVTWIRLLAHYLLLRPAVFLLGWPRVIGREHLLGLNGPVLVICNHIDDVDVGFVLTALPARFRHQLTTAAGGEAMEALRTSRANRGVFGRIWDRVKWISGAALLNIFPLPRQAGFRQSFAYAGEAVERGYSVLVFPEGRHTTTGGLLPFRPGIGILGQSLGIPMVPMRIDGLFKIKQAGKRFARPGAITVRIGRPVRFDEHANPESVAHELQAIVAEL
jgi:long-chain acyl-CoA synthetase